MAAPSADRNLLFGVLALQMHFITQDALVKAMNAWALNKVMPLGAILVHQGALADDTCALLETLVQKHLAMHGDDAEKSLAAAGPLAPPVHETLMQIAEPDLQASLGHLASDRTEEDPYATHVPAAPGPAAAAPDPPAPSGFRFRVLRPHARGGLGEVHVAQDEELRREVALKQIQNRHADHPESRARFLLEAEITGGLEHPGIVPVYGLGVYADGRPYYAMRFIQGHSLKDAIERFHQADVPGRDPGERALEVRQLLGRFIAVCNAIEYAHSRGIMHRDLKPANIMLGDYGETLVVDWGLAKPMDQKEEQAGQTTEKRLTPSSASLSSPTLMGAAVGTPQFMSPEQAAGHLDELGPTSDVYSLGATLYCLLAGHAPFTDADTGTILSKVQKGDFVPLRQVKPDVPRALEAICLKAMATLRNNRYPSARLLADDIEHWLADEPVSAWREPWTVKACRWITRHRTLVTAATAAVLVAVVGLAVATVLLTAANERERQARDLAQEREQEAREQKRRAEHNYQLARKAVDRYHTEVSESVLLNEPGMQPLRKKLLEAAREFYGQFVREHEKDSEVKAELGKALFRLAQITGEIGSNQKAIALHEQALRTFLAVAGANRSPAAHQTDLAECRHHLGRLYRLTDQLPRAETSYQKALILWEQLVHHNPQQVRYQAGLALTQLGLGNVYQVLRRPEQAQPLYQDALTTRQKLVKKHPGVAEYQRDLAVTYNNLANIFLAQGQRAKAATAYRQGIDIQRQLVGTYPHMSQYQNDLARSLYNLANIHALDGQAAQSEGPYKEAADLWKKLADKHPAVTEFRGNLVSVLGNLGSAYFVRKQWPAAEQAFRHALQVDSQLTRDHADTPSSYAALARCHANLGDIYRATNRAGQADAAYQEALRLQGQLVHEHPDVPQYQTDQARTATNLGLLYLTLDQKKKAEKSFHTALACWEQLVTDHSSQPEFALGLCKTCSDLGNLAANVGKLQTALGWYGQGIRKLAGAIPSKQMSPPVRNILQIAHAKRAEVLALLDRQAEAVRDWDQALRLADPHEQFQLRMNRTLALARSGQYERASAEAGRLAGRAPLSGSDLYQLACVYSQAAGAAEGDARLPVDRRANLTGDYVRQAVEMLSQALAAGYFKTPDHVDQLKQAPDLNPVRAGVEFKQLLQQLAPPEM
jgi:serine/threonine-protein kinase